MSAMTIREALLSMAYREVLPGWWLKPVGLHLFTFKEENGVWTNWYKAGTGEIEAYERHEIKEGERVLSEIKQHEAYTRINITTGTPEGTSSFELSAFDVEAWS